MPRLTRVDEFSKVYGDKLEECVKLYPDEYYYGIADIPITIERMKNAFISGSYNHNSKAIKMTCRALNIAHTRRAMETFFNS